MHAAFEDEAVDPALVVLGPHDHEVGDGRVRDPRLGARKTPAAVDPACPRAHAAGVRSVVGLGEAEAAELVGPRHGRQVAFALRLAAEEVDRHHGERRLHAERGPEGGVDALELARDEPVAHVADAGAAEPVDGRTEKPQLRHFLHDGDVEGLVAIGFENARHQLCLRIVPRRIADQGFLGREQIVEPQGIAPVEGNAGHAGALQGLGIGYRTIHGGLSGASGRPELGYAGLLADVLEVHLDPHADVDLFRRAVGHLAVEPCAVVEIDEAEENGKLRLPAGEVHRHRARDGEGVDRAGGLCGRPGEIARAARDAPGLGLELEGAALAALLQHQPALLGTRPELSLIHI